MRNRLKHLKRLQSDPAFLRRFFCGILFLSLIAFPACSNERGGEGDADESHTVFRKINARLTLTRGLVRHDYEAGKKGQIMTFLLKNEDLRNVAIDDWRMREMDNIRLLYAPCEPGKSDQVKENDWKPGFIPKSSEMSRRMPCILAPNNRIVMDVPMDFLETFPMHGKWKRTVAVRAEMISNTLDVKSPVYELEVRPKIVEIQID